MRRAVLVGEQTSFPPGAEIDRKPPRSTATMGADGLIVFSHPGLYRLRLGNFAWEWLAFPREAMDVALNPKAEPLGTVLPAQEKITRGTLQGVASDPRVTLASISDALEGERPIGGTGLVAELVAGADFSLTHY